MFNFFRKSKPASVAYRCRYLRNEWFDLLNDYWKGNGWNFGGSFYVADLPRYIKAGILSIDELVDSYYKQDDKSRKLIRKVFGSCKWDGCLESRKDCVKRYFSKNFRRQS